MCAGSADGDIRETLFKHLQPNELLIQWHLPSVHNQHILAIMMYKEQVKMVKCEDEEEMEQAQECSQSFSRQED